jgi:hypothetical protein
MKKYVIEGWKCLSTRRYHLGQILFSEFYAKSLIAPDVVMFDPMRAEPECNYEDGYE